MPEAPEAKVRARVAQMGLATEKMDTAAEKLSGGEKARLLMGLATLDAPHLLILDEPTNHLDIEARDSLIHALNDYPGAVILISHDRHIVEATVDRLWLVEQGTVKRFDGDLTDYKRLVLAKARSSSSSEPETEELPQAPVVTGPTKAEQRKLAAERRDQLKPLKKKISQLEIQISRLQKTIAEVEARLADPAIYQKDPQAVAKLGKEKAEAERTLASVEEEWLALSEEHEAALEGLSG